jgi:hypothetical protein
VWEGRLDSGLDGLTDADWNCEGWRGAGWSIVDGFKRELIELSNAVNCICFGGYLSIKIWR